MSAHFKILVIVGKKINIQGWSVLKGGPSVECAKKTDNLKRTLVDGSNGWKLAKKYNLCQN